ncbi:GntR family transcriptional regulator [Agrococcus casei]|uniref:GntR family transcriptional regulator n=1 Tax=Agrococcus casei TaxID=343512 RepID=UPI003F92880D
MRSFAGDRSRGRFSSWSTTPDLPSASRPEGVKAAEFAYVYLKDLIVTLALHPGTILTEVQVAAATGVSRTPVREAFFRLSSERLLDILPRRGAVVPEITVRGIREQAETRYVLEGHGVEWICENEIEIADDLKSLIAQQRHVLDTEPDAVVEMVSIDKEFHWELVRATGNTEFAQLYNTLHDRQMRLGIAMFEAIPERRASALDQHTGIAEALEAHDVDKALELLKLHLLSSLTQVADVFAK